MVELRQLVYFEAVARHGGFTRAAEHLRIAQPAVSAQIRKLERELGVRLFARTTRSTTLTTPGRALLARVRRITAELDAARVELEDFTGITRGQVTLGATRILGPLDLPRILAAFHTAYPGVTVTLRAGTLDDLLARLDDEEVDLVLGPIDQALPEQLISCPLVDEDLVLITPLDHRLASRAGVALSELGEETFVAFSRSSGLDHLLEAAAGLGGFTPTVRFEAVNPSSIRELVSAGLGVALIGGTSARLPGGPITIHPIRPIPPMPPFGLIHRRERPTAAAVHALRHHLLQQQLS